jgi:hypothetical protein
MRVLVCRFYSEKLRLFAAAASGSTQPGARFSELVSLLLDSDVRLALQSEPRKGQQHFAAATFGSSQVLLSLLVLC